MFFSMNNDVVMTMFHILYRPLFVPCYSQLVSVRLRRYVYFNDISCGSFDIVIPSGYHIIEGCPFITG